MLRRLLLSFLFVLFVSLGVKADPVLLPGTVTGGTITANSLITTSVEGTLLLLDPNGNPVVVQFASMGGSLNFLGVPGTPVVFSAGIAGSADFGPATMFITFTGTGPAIPNVNTPTLDSIGTGNIQFHGTVFANHTDMFIGQNPLFTFSGSFSGPVALHFIRDFDGSYQLRTATAVLTPVPEPLSLLLFGTGIAGATMSRRFSRNRRG